MNRTHILANVNLFNCLTRSRAWVEIQVLIQTGWGISQLIGLPQGEFLLNTLHIAAPPVQCITHVIDSSWVSQSVLESKSAFLPHFTGRSMKAALENEWWYQGECWDGALHTSERSLLYDWRTLLMVSNSHQSTPQCGSAFPANGVQKSIPSPADGDTVFPLAYLLRLEEKSEAL